VVIEEPIAAPGTTAGFAHLQHIPFSRLY
jgi:hypothetical protein